MVWYCDSSALIKTYVRELGSRWFREQQSHHHILTSELAIAEIPSALSRRKREGTISTFEFHRGRAQFTRHLRSKLYTLLPADLNTIELAVLLIYRHPLAAYDGIHLATALIYSRSLGASDDELFRFICADNQLRRAAEAEGLKAENPNDHP